MLVVDVIGDQIVLAYLRMGLVMVLYVVVSVSFCFPQLVPESALSTLVVRNVFDDCVWDVGVVDLLDEFVNVDCVEGFTSAAD